MDPDPTYACISRLSSEIARSYVQIKADLADSSRLSWAGTAHEIRESLRAILELLAPDSEVLAQAWYVQDKNTTGPTHRQRVQYILQLRGAGSKEQAVTSTLSGLDELVPDIVRKTYARASDAAHGNKTKNEVQRIFNYYCIFVRDLLE
ncbi:MAG: pPIWI-associating nuclease domain-containing protein [Anaerolineae bacterium]